MYIDVYMLLQRCVCRCIDATTYMSTLKHASYIHILYPYIHAPACGWASLPLFLSQAVKEGEEVRGVCVCVGGQIQGEIALMMAGIVLQRVAVCWSVLECVGVCWSVLQCVAMLLQCFAACGSVLQCIAAYCSVNGGATFQMGGSVLVCKGGGGEREIAARERQ